MNSRISREVLSTMVLATLAGAEQSLPAGILRVSVAVNVFRKDLIDPCGLSTPCNAESRGTTPAVPLIHVRTILAFTNETRRATRHSGGPASSYSIADFYDLQLRTSFVSRVTRSTALGRSSCESFSRGNNAASTIGGTDMSNINLKSGYELTDADLDLVGGGGGNSLVNNVY